MQFLISGRSRRPKDGLLPYLQYLSYVASRKAPLTSEEKFIEPYLDYLQV